MFTAGKMATAEKMSASDSDSDNNSRERVHSQRNCGLWAGVESRESDGLGGEKKGVSGRKHKTTLGGFRERRGWDSGDRSWPAATP